MDASQFHDARQLLDMEHDRWIHACDDALMRGDEEEALAAAANAITHLSIRRFLVQSIRADATTSHPHASL